MFSSEGSGDQPQYQHFKLVCPEEYILNPMLHAGTVMINAIYSLPSQSSTSGGFTD